jgi:hypothetical protein
MTPTLRERPLAAGLQGRSALGLPEAPRGHYLNSACAPAAGGRQFSLAVHLEACLMPNRHVWMVGRSLPQAKHAC